MLFIMCPNVFDYIYEKEHQSPWTFTEPPEQLADFMEDITPCRVLDVGCGEGYISIYLASKGFNVTGIDISGNAVRLAKKHAQEVGIKCKFLRLDWKDIGSLPKFDFIIDWRFLHEITDIDQRKKYVELVSKSLTSKGIYLSVAFSGSGKRKSPMGIELYAASDADLEKLFKPHFKILRKDHFRLPQKGVRGGVKSYLFFMHRK